MSTSDYDDTDEFCTPEIKAMLSYHSGVLNGYSRISGRTTPELKEFLLDTAARIYDLIEQIPVPDFRQRN